MSEKAQGWSYIGILAVLFSLMMFSNLSNAEGGKVQEANPVFDEDGDVVGIVVPADCEKYGSLQSGKVVYFCTVDGD